MQAPMKIFWHGLLSLLLLPAFALAMESSQAEINELYQAARLWETKKRDDLALDALRKAKLIDPDNVIIACELGLIAIRNNHLQDAKDLLSEIEKQKPNDSGLDALRDALRLATTSRHDLSTAIFISKKAPRERGPLLPLLKTLFPGGQPRGEPGLTYYHLLGRIPGHEIEALTGLKRLQSEMNGDSRPEFEMAIIELKSDMTREHGLDRMVVLSTREDLPLDEFKIVFEDGLSETEKTPKTQRFFAAYGKRFPDSPPPELVLSEEEKKARAHKLTQEAADHLAAQAHRQLSQGDSTAARASLEEASRLDPENKEHAISLGRILLKLGVFDGAEVQFRRVLRQDPSETRAASGLLQSLNLNGKSVEAIQWGQHFITTQRVDGGVKETWVSIIRQTFNRLVSQNKNQEAMKLLESALSIVPGSGWIRFDLATLDADSGHPERGRQRFEGQPINPQTTKAEATYLSNTGDLKGALELLHQHPEQLQDEALKGLESDLTLRLQLGDAIRLDQSGHHSEAIAEVQAACKAQTTGENGWRCAEGYAAINEKEKALALGNATLNRNRPPTVDDTLRFSDLLYRLKEQEQLKKTLQVLQGREDLGDSQRLDINSLASRTQVREAWALRRNKMSNEAIEALETAHRSHPEDIRVLAALAEMKLLHHDYAEAISLYQAAGRLQPENSEWKLSLAEALWRNGDKQESLVLLRQTEPLIPLTDPSRRIQLARIYILSGQDEHGEALLAGVRSRGPSTVKDYLSLAEADRSARNFDQAMIDLDAVDTKVKEGQLVTDDKEDLEEARELHDNIAARRFGFYTSGIDVRQLNGTSGTSQILNIDSPNQIRIADGYSGHFLVQTDYSGVFAGDLDTYSYANASQFGTIHALCTPGAGGSHTSCINPAAYAQNFSSNNLTNSTLLPTSINQQAQGGNLAVGYQWDHWQVDLGSTPIGFPVTNIVGGVHHSGSIGEGFYSVDIYRRPMPNSLMSYAGARDPVTGLVWGGVTANGGGFYSGMDFLKEGFGTWSGFLQGSAQFLEGQNVRSNGNVMVRTGSTFSFIDDDDMELSLGLAGMFLEYANNQRHYTYGYGGYWSPQLYGSATIPLEWSGRTGDLSYLFRSYVAYSYSSESAGAYYPTSTALQYSPLNQNAYWAGTSGTALSYGVRAKVEYRVTPEFFLGAHFEKAQSPFYTPNYLGVYFRCAFEPFTAPLSFPPENPLPYNRW
jgi:cellulose synthase operon protein C